MGKTSDQLREEIAAKREDAADKIDQIEAKVQELPNLAKESVMETVDTSIAQAREKVTDTVTQVKQQIDVPGQVVERPLAAVGVAFAGGYLLGKLLGGGNGSQGRYRTDWDQAHSYSGRQEAAMRANLASGGYTGGQYGSAAGVSSGSYGHERQGSGEGIAGTLKNAARSAGLEETLSGVGTALIATLTEQFHRTLRDTFPEFAQQLEQQGALGSSDRQRDEGMTGRFGGGHESERGAAAGSFGEARAGTSESIHGSGGQFAGTAPGPTGPSTPGAFEAASTEFGRRGDYDRPAGDAARTYGQDRDQGTGQAL
jgi:ElaB/YqjD/DUF883 family membrane-anchored ribosome-binding protein